ncbi:hypothetical protein [Brevibacillus laterosporus]|uniref:hypothetical protein n=1 Tax=Brevibacillus laterosporus TaxID=1465 RepID=UPI002E1BD4EE|nr:hypothetical protein [Brevibacillus laterosporus]MED1667296.1 hypothetical protein [Brevibacillus laterosporus]MED1718243.1 hypothetical protein [Brevibacillus laterosporus]
MQTIPDYPVKRNVYYCVYNGKNNSFHSIVTDEYEYALSIDSKPQLATLQQLKVYANVGEVFYGLLNTYDGTVEWKEYTYTDKFGEEETFEDYILI